MQIQNIEDFEMNVCPLPKRKMEHIFTRNKLSCRETFPNPAKLFHDRSKTYVRQQTFYSHTFCGSFNEILNTTI